VDANLFVSGRQKLIGNSALNAMFNSWLPYWVYRAMSSGGGVRGTSMFRKPSEHPREIQICGREAIVCGTGAALVSKQPVVG